LNLDAISRRYAAANAIFIKPRAESAISPVPSAVLIDILSSPFRFSLRARLASPPLATPLTGIPSYLPTQRAPSGEEERGGAAAAAAAAAADRCGIPREARRELYDVGSRLSHLHRPGHFIPGNKSALRETRIGTRHCPVALSRCTP
jgi:hypothetical protein